MTIAYSNLSWYHDSDWLAAFYQAFKLASQFRSFHGIEDKAVQGLWAAFFCQGAESPATMQGRKAEWADLAKLVTERRCKYFHVGMARRGWGEIGRECPSLTNKMLTFMTSLYSFGVIITFISLKA